LQEKKIGISTKMCEHSGFTSLSKNTSQRSQY